MESSQKKTLHPHNGHIGHCRHLADLYFGINNNIRVGQKMTINRYIHNNII